MLQGGPNNSHYLWVIESLSSGMLCLFTVFLSSAINECAISKPCKNNATCFDLVNGYRCQCRSGFQGKNCDTGNVTEFCTNVIEKYCLHMKRKWSRNLSTNVLQSYKLRSEQQLYITNRLSLVRRASYIRNFHNTNKEYWQWVRNKVNHFILSPCCSIFRCSWLSFSYIDKSSVGNVFKLTSELYIWLKNF